MDAGRLRSHGRFVTLSLLPVDATGLPKLFLRCLMTYRPFSSHERPGELNPFLSSSHPPRSRAQAVAALAVFLASPFSFCVPDTLTLSLVGCALLIAQRRGRTASREAPTSTSRPRLWAGSKERPTSPVRCKRATTRTLSASSCTRCCHATRSPRPR